MLKSLNTTAYTVDSSLLLFNRGVLITTVTEVHEIMNDVNIRVPFSVVF